jgi:hypothetical protein
MHEVTLKDSILPPSRKARHAQKSQADGVVEMVADFGVEFFFTLLAPELVEPVEFHAARSCFVNINNSCFLNIAYFGAEDDF